MKINTVLFLVPVVVIPVATAAVVIPSTIEQLHRATVQQCQQRDWPQHQAPQHEEFCRVYVPELYR